MEYKGVAAMKATPYFGSLFMPIFSNNEEFALFD